MNKRIRYGKIDNFMQSRGVFASSVGDVYVKIFPENLLALIINATNDEVIKSFNSKTSHELKKEIKNTLINMGVVFVNETRIRE